MNSQPCKPFKPPEDKFEKALERTFQEMEEAIIYRRITDFLYWIAALELLWKDPKSVWDCKKEDFFILDPDLGGSEPVWELVESFNDE